MIRPFSPFKSGFSLFQGHPHFSFAFGCDSRLILDFSDYVWTEWFSQFLGSILIHTYVPISARNILEDRELKRAVKAFSNWPTFPQIFIKGEFLGGSDIILNIHQNGNCRKSLKISSPSSIKAQPW
ncbi:hypothetical protein RIF29_03329 [Crotalaria pallida]|uniref:Glutaredoxin domain-containing protein n=1 Tax=Crotalaria pallida TaxID=3830 RepID=A0AAN9J017_CROPI